MMPENAPRKPSQSHRSHADALRHRQAPADDRTSGVFVQPTELLRRHLESRLDSSLELLELMVGINSFTQNPAGIIELAHTTAAAFQPLGFHAEFIPARGGPFGEHLFLTKPGTSGRGVALISHLDTVFPPEEEERNDFRWQVEGDRIYGPGTVDIKGGTVLIHLILSALQAVTPEAFGSVTWQVMLNAAEEDFSSNFATGALERLSPETLACLVFEAGGWDGDAGTVVTARKGRAVYRVAAAGRAAHAGSRHRNGANAIAELARTVTKIEALTQHRRDLTFNVGTIRGGSVVNRVPHAAEASVEMRAFTAEAYEAGKAAILALAGPGEVASLADGKRCEVTVEVLEQTAPWPTNDGTEKLAEIWQKAGRAQGMKIFPEHRGGLSDGNYVWDRFPTIDGLGPAGDNAHCSERSADGSKLPEYVERSSFVPKALLNARAILELIGAGE